MSATKGPKSGGLKERRDNVAGLSVLDSWNGGGDLIVLVLTTARVDPSRSHFLDNLANPADS